ncbi:SusC/RagA family TonB-linked outer membrane protein [Membranihabitans maritimus]|uniref:SusC/RagA family TonB-linked outer membrane protein n=1 Tax=Membranihabitans maritimus TaxID=2904244 RepID=UPI001F0054F3|nr:SusC/RagA family TonB-linked outer membrane protein [Membranihabitans maritimus]
MKVSKLCEKSYMMWLLCLFFIQWQLPALQAKEMAPRDKIELSKAISMVSNQYKVLFNYDQELVADIKVNYSKDESKTVHEAISDLLQETNLEFKIFDDRYVILYKRDKEGMKSLRKMVDHFQGILDKDDGIPHKKYRPVKPISPLERKNLSNRRVVLNIHGKVTDQNGEPLIGVNVLVKGTNNGTSTDFNGEFTIEDIDANAVIIFSYIGYRTKEVSISGKNNINVSLEEDLQTLDEVVVTAFGIEREKKALSYSVQELEGESISAVGNANVVNSLQGKVAGVIVKQYSGAPGTQHRVTIRGSRTFTGNNEPLYVIDGLPVASGGRTVDINPNDVKSINVLKGPTAAALYGLRASNGVIIIETKKGEGISGGKPTISFETNYNFDQLSLKPDLQTTYAQGENGQFVPYSAFSWGPRIDTMGIYVNQLGEMEEAAIYDNVGDLFKTGGTSNTNLLISNSLDKGNYAINFGFTDQEGILDNFDMQRINAKFAGGYDLSNQLKISTSINYTNNVRGSVDLPWWGTFAVPVSYNLKDKPTHEPGEPYKQINFRGQHANYYWALENNYSDARTSRTFGNISLDYTPVEWLKFNYRFGLDNFTDSRKAVTEKGSNRTDPPSGGTINNSIRDYQQINSNLNITFDHKISDDFQFDFMVGNEFYDIRSINVSNNGSDIVIGGFHHISNTLTQTTDESLSRSRVFGLFGNLSLSWKSAVFLNATGRNDVVSNMPRNNRSFFYPSVGLGVAFTEFLSIPESILTFGKLRVSVAEVGQAGPAHSTENLYVTGSPGGFNFPYQGLNAFSHSNQLNANDLSPENTSTFEIGADLRFLNNRLGIDYTYYDSKASGQIYRVPIALSTGYSSELRNAGEMSIKGHEMMLNITPIETTHFRWDLTTNFTTYKNKVISLAEGIDQLELGGFRVTLVAQPGEEYPSLRGWGYLRDPASGEVVVDHRTQLPNGNTNPRYGMPLRSTEQVILGSAQPDFEIGFGNQLSFKNITISMQLDWRQGGKVSSGYNRLGKLYGVLSETENRESTDYIFPGKKGYYGENGNIIIEGDNDIAIARGWEFFRRNQDQISESNVYDATFLRLRELKITYDLPKKWTESSFAKSASFYLIGRNLWLNASMPHFDPEMFNQSEGESYNTYPQTKSFGGGIRINL